MFLNAFHSVILSSAVVGPRCPLKMDPDLDYEADSDDEWEEVIGDFAPLFSFFLARGTHVVWRTGGSW